eukprot:13368010-Ditylum_brightwellii.AAC.1
MSYSQPQESADYQGCSIFVMKQQTAVGTFPLKVGDFQGCNFQGCYGALYLKIQFGTQRACWLLLILCFIQGKYTQHEQTCNPSDHAIPAR